MFGWLWRAADAWRHRLRLRAMAPHLAWGARAEDLAHRHLEARGMRVIARNWRRPGRRQEIDIVALDGEQVVFVEVKSRHDALYAPPDRNVDHAKRLNTARAALDFARSYRLDQSRLRFDLVSIVFEPYSIEHQPDAWSLKTGGLG
jgi:putative endonuclease